MGTDRREFIKGTAWMGVAAAAAGCLSDKASFGGEGKMATYADKPFAKLRVGVIGLGRGDAAINGFSHIPGNEIVAVCDLNASRIKDALAVIEKAGRPKPRVYTGGEEEWKKVCDSPDVDLVYNATPWNLHVPIALYAMKAGKHVVTEVPSAFTVDECWELVETSERLGRHCMQLENCCYGEAEMLALNICKQGLLGELVHGEGAYIHDLREMNYAKWNHATNNRNPYAYWNYWRLRHNTTHKGNQYTTHGLGPLCWYMDINRGDRMDYLVSLESNQANFEAYAKTAFPAESWEAKLKVAMGDMNTMLIKTAKGRSIMIQHDVSSPRPYTRINRISGTLGMFDGSFDGGDTWYARLALSEKPGAPAHGFLPKEKLEAFREKYRHPLWKQAGELAKKMGGHGGMDFLMVLRVSYCLQNGLPLDQNVYDLASWCSLCELSEKSVRSRSASVDIPDFTRGAWKTTPPIGDLSIDTNKLKI